MTDSNHTPNPSSTSSPPDYEGTDPDLPDRKNESPRSGISTVQVGASAAAAVTSALAASFFGVAGTLIGAAVGSIVSTIAGALYADYLGRAGQRIKVTRSVVIQRIPSEVLTTTPLRRLAGPSDLPGRESLRPIGNGSSDETVAVPVEEATELLQRPEGMAPLNQTSVLPAQGSPPPRPFWKKPLVAMSAVSVAGFLIALGVVLTTETMIGHPVSGGRGGTTISRLGNSDPVETKVTPTEAPAETPGPTTTETPTQSPTATETPSGDATSVAPVDPTPTTDPTATGEPTATAEPTPEPTDPGVGATGPGADAAP